MGKAEGVQRVDGQRGLGAIKLDLRLREHVTFNEDCTARERRGEKHVRQRTEHVGKSPVPARTRARREARTAARAKNSAWSAGADRPEVR